MFSKLPIDIVTIVFNFLDTDSKINLSYVSHTCNEIYWRERCWKEFRIKPQQRSKNIFDSLWAIHHKKSYENCNDKNSIFSIISDQLITYQKQFSQDTWSLFYLAILYLNVQWEGQSINKGLEFLDQGVTTNDKYCYRLLACLHRDNKYGKSPNAILATQCFQKAIDKGDYTAARMLGESYLEGKGCIKKNMDQAIIYLKKAVEMGDANCSLLLSRLFRNNENEADKYLRIGAERGDNACKLQLEIVEQARREYSCNSPSLRIFS